MHNVSNFWAICITTPNFGLSHIVPFLVKKENSVGNIFQSQLIFYISVPKYKFHLLESEEIFVEHLRLYLLQLQGLWVCLIGKFLQSSIWLYLLITVKSWNQHIMIRFAFLMDIFFFLIKLDIPNWWLRRKVEISWLACSSFTNCSESI